MDAQHRGHPSYSSQECAAMVAKCMQRNLDLQIHCNGDAAIDLALDAVERYCGGNRAEGSDRPPMVTIIHCQTVRNDQLDRMARLGCVHPSFFVGHTWHWGVSGLSAVHCCVAHMYAGSTHVQLLCTLITVGGG
jgi:predicted amidohydrolase YtcJ